MKSRVISRIWSVCKALDKARANSYSARTRLSRWAATRAWKRRPEVSWPMIRPTTSITAKVTRYCTSLTANEKRGGTKKKSNASHAQESRQHRRPAPEPHRHQHHGRAGTA